MSEKIVILGGGESGVGSAVLALKKGYSVFLSDAGKLKDKYRVQLEKTGVEWEEGGHTEEKIMDAKEIIKSPGIPETVPLVRKAAEKGIRIISEIEFAARYTKAVKVCITGSNGKTTTTSLIYHILKTAGLNVGLAGNIGKSFAMQVAGDDHEYYVIELSSFQLDTMYDFKAEVAVLLNITPDHLDRYNYEFQNYIDSKFRIIRNQGPDDYFIYWNDDPVISKQLEVLRPIARMLPFSDQQKIENGAYRDNENIYINTQTTELTMSIQDLALQGRHNTYNSMAAGIAASVLRIRKSFIRECLMDFQSVEHRLEPVVKVHGIQFINDSKATNVNSTWYALESMTGDVIWIAGGVDKGNDYEQLTDLVQKKVKAIVCLGKDNSKFHETFGKLGVTVMDTTSMREAVKTAYYLAKKGDTVLLSPACASFDLFENYEDRGWQFKNSVREL
ncbi:MAG: UDP-N-acetylmuramoyl-L-alanine--D-glutamate ligase [Bacteroidota bacterium]